MNKKGLGLKWILVAVVLLAALFLSLMGYITDYLWFKELGYVSVFFKQLFTQLKIGIPAFVIISILAYVYLKMLKRGYYKKVESRDHANEKTINRITLGLSAVFGVVVAFTVATGLWFDALRFTNATEFNVKDPLFNMDVGFYVFKLDFITNLNQTVIGIIIAFALLTVIYYMMLMSMRKPQMFEEVFVEPEEERYTGADNAGSGNQGGFESFAGGLGGGFDSAFKKFNQAFGGAGGPTRARPKKQFDDDNFMRLVHIASNQLIALGTIFFLMLGVNFFLRQYSLLYAHTGAVYGAGFTDVNITLWVFRVLMVLSVIAAITFAVGISKKKFKMIFTVPVIMIAIGALGTVGAGVVQNLVVSPDEINKESEYLKNNIKFTQMAYDLQNVSVKPFAATSNLTKEDIANNTETISNIRINDYEPVKKYYNNTQVIRNYYSFNDADVDRYMVNGEYTQTFLSAREIDETLTRQEWINKHLKYTHGYGITLSRVDKVTASGQPDVLIDSIPPVSRIDEIKITRPEIYFGELTNNYILTNTDELEFDYPRSVDVAEGEENAYATYKGNAGIKMNMFNRVMFAIKEKNLKLLVSTNIDSESKIIINRNIADRVKKIMPYVQYDEDPYIVTADGKLYWMIDAYTVSSRYPYSEPLSDKSSVNYIRNSVKVVIDAYNGDTNYYLVDDQDPIGNTLKEIYPKLFKDFAEMPESLQSHIRYPNFMFDVQANVYKRYHMNDVRVFYQGEDLWDIANEIYGTKEVPMTPNYYIMKLPGEERAEFVNSVPYTPKSKKNMTGLLVARNDGVNYGELVLYQLPKGKNINGPMQIEAQIDQNTEISKEFSLWNSSGSTYSRGNLFVVPIEESILYIEPVYLEATNSSIPEVKRVIVAYGDRIAYKETLAEALDYLFGSDMSTGDTGGGETNAGADDGALSQAQLIVRANDALIKAQDSQRAGDWSAYGKHLEELTRYLNMLATKEAPQQSEAAPTTGE